MEIKILNERENPLLNRKEIKLRVYFDAVIPKFKEVRKEVVSYLKTDEKLTIMNSIKTEFGAKYADCYVKIYKDSESMKVEPKFRIRKNFEEKKPESKKEEIKEKKPE